MADSKYAGSAGSPTADDGSFRDADAIRDASDDEQEMVSQRRGPVVPPEYTGYDDGEARRPDEAEVTTDIAGFHDTEAEGDTMPDEEEIIVR